MKERELEELHERIATVLKWEVEETYRFSLAALRALVRTEDPGLYQELEDVILRGDYLLIEVPPKKAW